MFNIEPIHISALGTDSDLRELVVQLCRAELHHFGQPLSALTAGGHQDASDGGVDVRVDPRAGIPNLDFIPRPRTIFQVKVTNLGPSGIKEEMCPAPGGTLRPSIKELAEQGGAYVIVSAKASLTDPRLKKCLAAMREAAEIPGLVVDFYDCTRLARWVNQYPGAALWLRDKIGQPLLNWQPWRNWSRPQSPQPESFLFDAQARMTDGSAPQDDARSTQAMTIQEGIERIRAILSRPGGIVRLVGLSGTGKTRLAQALFEPGIGKAPLAPALAMYTDLGYSQDPPSEQMIARLRQSGHRAILIIDNCPPKDHTVLAEMCRAPDGHISLLTIEYDVRDDVPEGTEVFRLDTASAEVIVRLLGCRHPRLSESDRWRIADLSGHNSRLALAMADAIRRRKTLAGLDDEALFNRLFHQRHTHDSDLLRAAQVCALVYSFDVETAEGAGDELSVLAELAGLSRRVLYGHVAPLLRRQLMQQRGRWRAVLPHVLANRLASNALAELPQKDVLQVFGAPGRERLFSSFARRLGYLHVSPGAQAIVETWLAPDGKLGNLANLGNDGWKILDGVAPVAPVHVLSAIERAFDAPGGISLLSPVSWRRRNLGSLLAAIAWDGTHFRRCVTGLTRLSAAEGDIPGSNSVASKLEALFQITSSGTHAPLDTRLAIAEEVQQSQPGIGLRIFQALLRTRNFSSANDRDFGCRERDAGWHPQTDDDINNWFLTVIGKTEALAKHDQKMRSLLASEFPHLWAVGRQVSDAATQSVARIAESGFWPEGWIAAKIALRSANGHPDVALLLRLEEQLRPKTLEDRALAYVLSRPGTALDIAKAEEDDHRNWEKIDREVSRLGEDVARDPEVMDRLLPIIVSTGAKRAGCFGEGLGKAAPNASDTWERLLKLYENLPTMERDFALLGGFLSGLAEHDRPMVEFLLDQAVCHSLLMPVFSWLQNLAGMNEVGVARSIRAIRQGQVKSWQFRHLSGMGKIAPTSICDLLLTLADTPETGPIDALSLLYRVLVDRAAAVDPEICACGLKLITQWATMEEAQAIEDHYLAHILAVCLPDEIGADVIASLCQKLVGYVSDYHFVTSSHRETIEFIMKAHPIGVLDGFLLSNNRPNVRIIQGAGDATLFDAVPTGTLLAWAERDGSARFPLLAEVIRLFDANGVPTPAMLDMIEMAPNRADVLEVMSTNLTRATTPEQRANGLQMLVSHPDPTVSLWASRTIADARAIRLRFNLEKEETFE